MWYGFTSNSLNQNSRINHIEMKKLDTIDRRLRFIAARLYDKITEVFRMDDIRFTLRIKTEYEAEQFGN